MLKTFLLFFTIVIALLPRLLYRYYSISTHTPDDEYDYIIVGAGISGSVIANRLSENKNIKILLVEAGEEDTFNFKVSVPLLYSWSQLSDIDWKYKTVPQSLLNNQEVPWPRGKVVGGTSAINSMIYIRGSPHTYNAWEEMGADGWNYKDLLPYFKKMEDATALGTNSESRGKEGPLKISFPFVSPISHYFVEAGRELGYSSGDYNAENIEGFHYVQATVARGRRQSSAESYLRPIASARKNHLHIVSGTQVSKLLIEKNEDGKPQATGVVTVRDGQVRTVRARKEVILSAGSVGTPQLLMLSGIGPQDHLKHFKIAPVVDRPGVGQNLQDHVALSACWVVEHKKPGDVISGSTDILSKLLAYFSEDNGGPLGSSGGAEVQAIVRTKFAVGPRPDLHLLIDASHWEDGGWFGKPPASRSKNDGQKIFDGTTESRKRDTFCDFTVSNVALRSNSIGNIRLNSSDYRDSPVIDPKYLSNKQDLEVLVEGFRLMEKLEKTKTFQKIGARMVFPLDECRGEGNPRSRECLEAAVRQSGRSIYHPVGVAKIGRKEDPMRVVDPRLKVYGVEGLRVADASVMPDVPSATTQAACYVIGEKAADLIKEDWKLL